MEDVIIMLLTIRLYGGGKIAIHTHLAMTFRI